MTERKHKTASYRAKQTYLLSGKIVCGECGSTYAGSSRGTAASDKMYVSYRCTKKNGAVKCKNPEFQRDKLEQIVLNKLSSIVFDEKILPQIFEKYDEYAASRNKTLNNEIAGIETRLREINKGIDNIIKVVMNTGSDALNDKLNELEADKHQKIICLEEAKRKLAENTVNKKQLEAAFKKAKNMLKNGTLHNKKAIVEKYINRITIYKNKVVIDINITDNFRMEESSVR